MNPFKFLHYISIIFLSAIIVWVFSINYELHNKRQEPARTSLHSTIYIDRGFSDFEKEAIITAALKWTSSTKYIIKFDVIQLPLKDRKIEENALFILKTTEDNPEIILMDEKSETSILAYFDNTGSIPTIFVAADRLSDDIYMQVILHEIGHYVGLKHITGEDNVDALMYPYIMVKINGQFIRVGSENITYKDLCSLCRIYSCNPDNLKN